MIPSLTPLLVMLPIAPWGRRTTSTSGSGLSAIHVPWDTLFLSVALYIVVPLIGAQVWRRALLSAGGEPARARMLHALHPVSLLALLVHTRTAVRLSGRAKS
jgi:ACR3 family arsenite efflux pump ArsB